MADVAAGRSDQASDTGAMLSGGLGAATAKSAVKLTQSSQSRVVQREAFAQDANNRAQAAATGTGRLRGRVKRPPALAMRILRVSSSQRSVPGPLTLGGAAGQWQRCRGSGSLCPRVLHSNRECTDCTAHTHLRLA